jgi:hypothetical protein
MAVRYDAVHLALQTGTCGDSRVSLRLRKRGYVAACPKPRQFCCTLLLVAGVLVTSRDAGLSVPDWPLSYGKLMPPMEGGILYEHGLHWERSP